MSSHLLAREESRFAKGVPKCHIYVARFLRRFPLGFAVFAQNVHFPGGILPGHHQSALPTDGANSNPSVVCGKVLHFFSLNALHSIWRTSLHQFVEKSQKALRHIVCLIWGLLKINVNYFAVGWPEYTETEKIAA